MWSLVLRFCKEGFSRRFSRFSVPAFSCFVRFTTRRGPFGNNLYSCSSCWNHVHVCVRVCNESGEKTADTLFQYQCGVAGRQRQGPELLDLHVHLHRACCLLTVCLVSLSLLSLLLRGCSFSVDLENTSNTPATLSLQNADGDVLETDVTAPDGGWQPGSNK